MTQELIKKLFDSLTELERSITVARQTFVSLQPENDELLQRIDNYEDVLSKQRQLAQSLRDYIEAQNWGEVTRHIKLINGLSALVHDDARALVRELVSGQKEVIDSAFSA